MALEPPHIITSALVHAVVTAGRYEELLPGEAAARLRRLAHDSPTLRRVVPPPVLAALLVDHAESIPSSGPFPIRVAEQLAAKPDQPWPDYTELPMSDWESRTRFSRIHEFSHYFLDADDPGDRRIFQEAIISEHPQMCREWLSEIIGEAEEAVTLFSDEEALEANLGRWIPHGGARNGYGSWAAWLRLIVQEGEAHMRQFHTTSKTPASTPGAVAAACPREPVSSDGGPVSSLVALLVGTAQDEIEDAVLRYRRAIGRRRLWNVVLLPAVIRLVRGQADSVDLSGTAVEREGGLTTVADLLELDLCTPSYDELAMNAWEAGEHFPALCELARLAAREGLPGALGQVGPAVRGRSFLAALLGEAAEALAMFPDPAQAEANLPPALGPGARDWLQRVRALAREQAA